MAAHAFETPNEKVISGAAALVMHALFFAMLVFSINWKRPEPVAMVADLWSSLPPVAAPRVEPPPPPPPKAEPKPPPPPKAEPKPVPKAEPKPQPKADIELREKRERERKAKEQAALEKKREEQALAEKKKREEQQRLEALKQQAKEAEARRLAQEQADAQRKLAQEQAAAQAREIDKYRQAIAARIRRFIVEPPGLQGNPVAELDIITLPGGEVLDVRTRKSSGQAAWDNACERAIRRAQPLPLPSDPALLKDFRELTHACRYKE